MHYPLAASTWDKAEITAIQNVIDADQYTMGRYVQAFEKDFAQKFGSRFAVMVNSGSSANLLAIAALCYKTNNPLKPGDEVIVPSLSWSTTYYPIHQYGLKLVFVDIDINTLNIDCSQLTAALSDKTKGIFVPNILGNPADLIALESFCKKHNLYLIEDNCESMGATLNKQQAGTFGICGTFSCFYSHHIATMEGGVVVTDDEEIYHLLLSLRSHGWTRHLPAENQLCVKSNNPFYESFRFILPGYNLRPVDMSGAIGIEQLKKLDHFIKVRRENAQYFTEVFSDDNRFIIQQENGESSWFGFSFILKDDTINRDTLVSDLIKNNIDTRPIVSGNFLKTEVMVHLNHRIVGEHPQVNFLDTRGFFVGNHHFDIKDKIDYLKKTIDSSLAQQSKQPTAEAIS